MDSREVKLKVRKFIKEFGVHELNYALLKGYVERQGYTVVEYSHLSNDEIVSSLINALNLSENICNSKGFTYADQNQRIVFIHEDLSDAEKLVVLSHEAGHIYLGHMSSAPIIGRDVQEEYEANEFAHFLMNPGKWDKIIASVRRHKVATILIAICLVVIVVAGAIFSQIEKEKQYYGEYYITSTGNKYHDKDCGYVKGKDNIEQLTIEQYESGEYEPCGVCLPSEA